MAGARQPTDLVVMNGRKHLTRAEEDARRDREVVVPAPQRAKPPKWLPKELHREFRAIGKQLIDVGLYTDLDADNLGRYLVAHHEYISATAEVQRALTQAPGHARDLEAADGWGRVQERYFKQARNCANDMGLTVSSRCRLVLPSNLPAVCVRLRRAPADDRHGQTLLALRLAARGADGVLRHDGRARIGHG